MPATLHPEAPAAAAEPEACPRSAHDAPSGSLSLSQIPFGLAIFLSAFLLFQVQLLLGKQILPIFGGAPAVWTSCLLVFQLLLFAGYAFAHGLAVKLAPRGQALVQLIFLCVSLALLALLSRVWPAPITPSAGWRPAAAADPTWLIVRFLLAAIGLPFFLLSTTSPLAQHWFAKAAPGRSPYRLYALSNAGSMLGLLSYPLLVEPNLRLRVQAWVWTAGYAAYAIAFAVCAILARRVSIDDPRERKPGDEPHEPGQRPGWPQSALWVTLAACASVLLLATTNFICQEVAAIPFLWVLPLCLYLLSFILCFEGDRWCRPAIFHPVFALAAGVVILVTLPDADYSYLLQLAACSALLFAGCMVCHGEAARTRPASAHLTQFYLCVASGGALGGIFVSLIAPRIFPNYWEYPLGILSCTALILFMAGRDASSWWHTGRASLAAALFGGVALLTPSVLAPVWPAARLHVWEQRGIAGALFVLAAVLYLRERRAGTGETRRWPIQLAARVSLALLTAGLAIPQKAAFFHVVARARNFYGVLSVVEAQPENYLALRHGKIVHGFQFQDPQRARLTTGYYGQNSPANIVIRNWRPRPVRVGLVGMGTGTLAAIGQPGDLFRFYEINPDVYRWSSGPQPYFTFLKDSPARVEVVLGDARVSLEREAARGEPQRFDVLVMDAFSSDAIPMHLLTREAFQLYMQHLRGPESVIAVHISNRTLDLSTVVAALTKEFGMSAVRCTTVSLQSYLWSSDWILLSRHAASLNLAELQASEIPLTAGEKSILWTDDYSNLLGVLR
jgi:hypothetical protein